MQKIKELSIFFPFWNEEANIEQVVKAAIPIASKIATRWEILIIDDGSTDKTLEIANRISHEFKNIRVISHNPNRGYGGALKSGFEAASFDTVVFTDGDSQFDFSEVDRFVKKIKENDIVIGFREKRRDNLTRHVLMDMLKIWDYGFFGFRFKDIDCGFKMFKKSAIETISPLRSEGAMITTEILAKAQKRNLKIAEVGVSHFPRTKGNQSGANLFVITRAVLESLMLWGELKSGRI